MFGSAARGADFDVARSDADLLVEFECWNGRDPYPGLKAELEKVLERRVDLLDREALERSHPRQAAVLHDAEVVFGTSHERIRAVEVLPGDTPRETRRAYRGRGPSPRRVGQRDEAKDVSPTGIGFPPRGTGRAARRHDHVSARWP